MKTIICFTILLLNLNSISFCQSEIDYQVGTGIVVEAGADICADTVIINGSFSIGGTICGSSLYVLHLTAFIEGFYNFFSNTIVSDTGRVYLRSASIPYSILDSSKAVLDSSGVGTFYFSNINNGINYYIVLKHRNSIETWSIGGNAFSAETLTYDFTPAANKAYGNNQTQIDNSPVKFGIYSGDVNQDGIVDIIDNQLIDNDSYNFVTGYVRTDVNGDNAVDLSDAAIVDNNVYNFVSKVRP